MDSLKLFMSQAKYGFVPYADLILGQIQVTDDGAMSCMGRGLSPLSCKAPNADNKMMTSDMNPIGKKLKQNTKDLTGLGQKSLYKEFAE